MNQFQSLVSVIEKEVKPPDDQAQSERNGDDATVRTATAISQAVFDHQLTKDEKKWAGPLVHYALGTVLGATYGILSETVPKATIGRGTAYGAAVWLMADEVSLPVLGLSKAPTEYPASDHIKALTSHLVYGFTTDLGARIIISLIAKGEDS